MTDEWDPTAYHNHRNMSFGASTLAHRIHTVPTKTMFGRYDEFQGNLQDAEYSCSRDRDGEENTRNRKQRQTLVQSNEAW